jgi:hypothetical protein
MWTVVNTFRTFASTREIGRNRRMLKHGGQEIIDNALTDLV